MAAARRPRGRPAWRQLAWPALAAACAACAAREWARRHACASAAATLDRLRRAWPEEPAAVADALRPALGALARGASRAEVLAHVVGAAGARCCARDASCAALEPHAAMLSALELAHDSLVRPRRIALRAARGAPPPRVVVVGAGPAGAPAALLAYREGASVTLVERRTAFTRQVWFDLEPPPEPLAGGGGDGGGMNRRGSGGGDGGGGEWNAQALLRAWGFFEAGAPHVPDEGGSGVRSVQCRTLEAYLLLLAVLLGPAPGLSTPGLAPPGLAPGLAGGAEGAAGARNGAPAAADAPRHGAEGAGGSLRTRVGWRFVRVCARAGQLVAVLAPSGALRPREGGTGGGAAADAAWAPPAPERPEDDEEEELGPGAAPGAELTARACTASEAAAVDVEALSLNPNPIPNLDGAEPTPRPAPAPDAPPGPGAAPGALLAVRFDLLVGADGPRSAVRRAAGLGWAERSSFEVAGGAVRRSEPQLSQASLNLALALEPSGRCPQPRRVGPAEARQHAGGGGSPGLPPTSARARDDDASVEPKRMAGAPPQPRAAASPPARPVPPEVPPHAVSFEVPGVSLAFKRLFEPYCELQLLLEEPLGARLLAAQRAAEAAERAAAPHGGGSGGSLVAGLAPPVLELARRVAARVLASPFEDVPALAAALRPRDDGRGVDASLLRLRVRSADAPGRLLRAPRRADGADGAAALAVLRGDSLVSAHYRLGIGVNRAFEALAPLHALLAELAADLSHAPARGAAARGLSAAGARRALRAWAHDAGGRARAMEATQLAHIYFEARCGFLVLGGDVLRRVEGAAAADGGEARAAGLQSVTDEELRALDCAAPEYRRQQRRRQQPQLGGMGVEGGDAEAAPTDSTSD